VLADLRQLQQHDAPFAIAYSGGADSTWLLHAARAQGASFIAIHIHHGLQDAADDFERHCVATCEALGVPLHVVRVDAKHAPGESPEDAARRARYAGLAECAQAHGVQTVLLAQHGDDQVETMLLALSRGAGLPGLAGMPATFERHGVTFHRPMLHMSASAIRHALKDAGVKYINDPTNADVSFTRNRIRREILPALKHTFPQYLDTFSRSARHAAQAQELLTLMGDEDLARSGGEPSIAALQAWPRARQANTLRRWLRTRHGVAASEAQLDELLDQVAACTTRGHDIQLKVAAGLVQRDADGLRYTSSV